MESVFLQLSCTIDQKRRYPLLKGVLDFFGFMHNVNIIGFDGSNRVSVERHAPANLIIIDKNMQMHTVMSYVDGLSKCDYFLLLMDDTLRNECEDKGFISSDSNNFYVFSGRNPFQDSKFYSILFMWMKSKSSTNSADILSLLTKEIVLKVIESPREVVHFTDRLEALRLDEDFHSVYLKLKLEYLSIALQGNDSKEYLRLAKKAVDHAEILDSKKLYYLAATIFEFELNNYHDAAQYYKIAMQDTISVSNIHFYYARSLLESNSMARENEAIFHLKKAVTVDRLNCGAYMKLACVARDSGNENLEHECYDAVVSNLFYAYRNDKLTEDEKVFFYQAGSVLYDIFTDLGWSKRSVEINMILNDFEQYILPKLPNEKVRKAINFTQNTYGIQRAHGGF